MGSMLAQFGCLAMLVLADLLLLLLTRSLPLRLSGRFLVLADGVQIILVSRIARRLVVAMLLILVLWYGLGVVVLLTLLSQRCCRRLRTVWSRPLRPNHLILTLLPMPERADGVPEVVICVQRL